MKRKMLWVLLVSLILVGVMVAGCSKGSSTSSSPAASSPAAPAQSQGAVQAGAQWPSQMPPDVPKFTYGTITGSSNNVMGSIQATFTNVTPDAFDKYQNDLKNAGWTISNAQQSANGFEIDAAKAPRGVVAMFIASKSEGLKGAVTYNDHSGQ